MSTDDDGDSLERWVQIRNKGHGYAGIFNYSNSDDKRTVEQNVIEEWSASVKAEFGIELGRPQHNPDDPPDFYISMNGRELKVELVQLVEQAHKKRAMKGETPSSGPLFQDMQWSRERLVAKLDEFISNKGKKYKKAGIEIDVLLIHTAEPWINSSQAQNWIKDGEIKSHPSIPVAFVLFDYEPYKDQLHWPVLKLYGELPS